MVLERSNFGHGPSGYLFGSKSSRLWQLALSIDSSSAARVASPHNNSRTSESNASSQICRLYALFGFRIADTRNNMVQGYRRSKFIAQNQHIGHRYSSHIWLVSILSFWLIYFYKKNLYLFCTFYGYTI